MVSEFPSFHRTVSSVSLLASKPIWDLSEKHCTSASSSGCPDLPRSSEERFWIHAVEASEAPLWGLQEFRPKMSVNIYKLKSLRESEDISQVTFKDLGFSLTSSSQKKPSCSNVGPPPGGPSVGEGTWDFINCKAAKAEWENAGELKESKTTGSHQVSIRSPSIHHPSLYVIDQAILFGWKVGQSDWGVVITSIFEDSLWDSVLEKLTCFWSCCQWPWQTVTGDSAVEKIMTCMQRDCLRRSINRIFYPPYFPSHHPQK